MNNILNKLYASQSMNMSHKHALYTYKDMSTSAQNKSSISLALIYLKNKFTFFLNIKRSPYFERQELAA